MKTNHSRKQFTVGASIGARLRPSLLGGDTLSTKYSFIPRFASGAKLRRVIAAMGSCVIVEFSSGTLRFQTMLKVPKDELNHFLTDCEREGALKGMMARPASFTRPFSSQP